MPPPGVHHAKVRDVVFVSESRGVVDDDSLAVGYDLGGVPRRQSRAQAVSGSNAF